MSRSRKFLLNSIFTSTMQIVTMIVGFILPRIILVTYGSELNGLVSSITQFISYFNLVEAGLSGAAVYALYKPLANDNHKDINGILSASKIFYNQAGYIFVSLTLGLAFIYPLLVNSNDISSLNIFLLVLILGVNGALEFFTLAKYRALLTADQKTYVISIATTIAIIINTIIIYIFSSLKIDIVVVRFIALFSIFLRSIILMIYCRKNYKYLDYSVKPNKVALNKRWDALYLQILGTIHTGAPTIIITAFLKNLSLVSVYSIYNMVLSGVNNLLSIFVSGLSASFGDVIARGEKDTLQKSYSEFECLYYMIITIFYGTTLVTIMSFINIYTKDIKDVNYIIPIYGILFTMNGYFFNLKTPQGMLVIAAGLYKETRIQTTIQGAITVFGGIILSFNFGLSGIIIASIISNIYRDIDLLFFTPKYVTGLPVFKTFKRMIISILIILFCYKLSEIINVYPNNLILWFGFVVGVFIIVSILTFIINVIFEKDTIKCLLNRTKGLMNL